MVCMEAILASVWSFSIMYHALPVLGLTTDATAGGAVTCSSPEHKEACSMPCSQQAVEFMT